MVIIDDGGNGDGDGGDAPCDSCRTQRAVVHCAHHHARLCLLCDLAVHRHTDATQAHRRAPLCDSCLAAPAVARLDDLRAFCATCAAAAAGDQCHRPAATYTGVPGPAEMAHILSLPPPPPPAVTEAAWITDTNYLNDDSNGIHMMNYYPEMFEDANLGIGKEMIGTTTTTGGKEEALLVDNANQQDYFQNWTNSFDSGALMGPAGALQEPSYFDLESYLVPDQKMQPDASLLQPPNMNNTPYDTNINNDIKATYSSSDNIEPMPQSSLLQPPSTMNNMPYDQLLPMIDTNTSNDASSEFPCVNFQSSSNTGLLGGSSMFDCQDQQASHVVLPEKSCPDPEKRQRAVDRYLQKKRNRRFDKQIMYASRKATADTRKRVRGRFVKASSEQGICPMSNKQPKHETN